MPTKQELIFMIFGLIVGGGLFVRESWLILYRGKKASPLTIYIVRLIKDRASAAHEIEKVMANVKIHHAYGFLYGLAGLLGLEMALGLLLSLLDLF